MAGVNRTVPVVENLPEREVRSVGEVQDHSHFFKCVHQWIGRWVEAAQGTRSVSVAVCAEMGEGDRPKPGVPPFLYLIGTQDRVGTLGGENESDRCFGSWIPPGFDTGVEVR